MISKIRVNDMPTFMGHFVLSTREREERNRKAGTEKRKSGGREKPNTSPEADKIAPDKRRNKENSFLIYFSTKHVVGTLARRF